MNKKFGPTKLSPSIEAASDALFNKPIGGELMNRAKIVKYLIGDFTTLKYKVVDFSPESPDEELPFTLYYCLMPYGRWQYCGDFGSLGDAEYYMKHRESLLANGDTVML